MLLTKDQNILRIFQELLSNLGIKYRMIPTEAPWQLGMVERHGAVITDIMNIVVNDSVVKGPQAMNDLALHASMVKNRRPGRTGYSPRSLVLGLDERLVASGLNHYLEEPDDSSMQASRQDPAFRNSLQIRKAAMKAIIELGHSDK